jgi:hypothetical protein
MTQGAQIALSVAPSAMLTTRSVSALPGRDGCLVEKRGVGRGCRRSRDVRRGGGWRRCQLIDDASAIGTDGQWWGDACCYSSLERCAPDLGFVACDNRILPVRMGTFRLPYAPCFRPRRERSGLTPRVGFLGQLRICARSLQYAWALTAPGSFINDGREAGRVQLNFTAKVLSYCGLYGCGDRTSQFGWAPFDFPMPSDSASLMKHRG